eukprot:11184186-Lingulodinium_polyedra.AAC.1
MEWTARAPNSAPRGLWVKTDPRGHGTWPAGATGDLKRAPGPRKLPRPRAGVGLDNAPPTLRAVDSERLVDELAARG